MEVIHLSGYTEDEKVEIAKRHLIPKQVERHGLKKGEWSISDEALRNLIQFYTREAGVRNLEREIANLTRKATKEILLKKIERVRVTRRNLGTYAGVRRYRHGGVDHEDLVGVTTGLAYTDTGGDLLLIETVTMPGKGKMTITGKLGDVMKESVQAAVSYVRSRAVDFGIEPPIFEKTDIHVHVPEGATPKDGPSAGIAIATSIVSVLTGIPVKSTLAMTGEVTLRGRVLPIGGLKEKLLAALRGGLDTVLIPKDNEKDLAEIPDNVKKGLNIVPVSTVDEVLEQALTSAPVPIEWVAADEVEAVASDAESSDTDTVVTH
jgi:ATP-dependent Lon protease